MTTAHGQLRSFVDRVCRINEDIKSLNSDKSEIYKEAKGNGFNPKVLKAAIKRYTQLQDDRLGVEEFDAILDLYMQALLGVSDDQEGDETPPATSASPAKGIVKASTRACASDLPPHDEDGVIIEPATIIVAAGEAGTRTSSCPQAGLTVSPTLSEPASAPSDAEAGQGDGTSRPSSVASPTVSTRRNQDEGDAAQPEERGTRTHGSTDGGDHEDEVASIPDTKSSDHRQVLDVPSGAVPGSAVESGAQVSQSGASLTPDAPVEAIGPPEPPGAPPSSPVDEWADLDIPARFDRREKAA